MVTFLNEFAVVDIVPEHIPGPAVHHPLRPQCLRAIYGHGDTLHWEKGPYIWAWGHSALGKGPLYMGMGTLCTGKRAPIYGHALAKRLLYMGPCGDRPQIAVWQLQPTHVRRTMANPLQVVPPGWRYIAEQCPSLPHPWVSPLHVCRVCRPTSNDPPHHSSSVTQTVG